MLGKLVRASVLDFNAVPYPSLRVGGVGSLRGLDVGFRTELSLARPCTGVTLTVVTFARRGQGGRPRPERPAGGPGDRARAAGRARDHAPGRPRHHPGGPRRALGRDAALRVCVVPDLRQLPGIVLEPVRRCSPSATLGVRDVRARSALAATKGKLDCMRALALPERTEPQGKGSLELTQELQDLADKRPDERWVDLVTGPAAYAVLYLVVDRAPPRGRRRRGRADRRRPGRSSPATRSTRSRPVTVVPTDRRSARDLARPVGPVVGRGRAGHDVPRPAAVRLAHPPHGDREARPAIAAAADPLGPRESGPHQPGCRARSGRGHAARRGGALPHRGGDPHRAGRHALRLPRRHVEGPAARRRPAPTPSR